MRVWNPFGLITRIFSPIIPEGKNNSSQESNYSQTTSYSRDISNVLVLKAIISLSQGVPK